MELNKSALIIILLVISATIVSLFVVPKYQESKNLEAELLRKQGQYESRVDYYVRLSDVLKAIEEQQDSLGKIESALPSKFAISPVLNYLQGTATTSGLLVNTITFSEQGARQISREDANSDINSIFLRADMSGSYQGLKDFLYSLEKSARIFEVNSISFSAGDSGKSKQSLYNFSLEIETHSY